MSDAALLAPVFVHVVLVFGILIATGSGRVAAVNSREVRIKDIALDNSRWPDRLRQRANNYHNQFELPVLFYALVALVIATGTPDVVFVVLAWAFVVSRLAHSFIHLGSNYVPHRLFAFAAGFVILASMWLWFAVRLYLTG